MDHASYCPSDASPTIGDCNIAPVGAVYDFGELLKDVPAGAWVAISQDEQRVVAYAAEMRDALSRAKELGEEFPIVFRVPQGSTAFVL
jgi:hypothetical protein